MSLDNVVLVGRQFLVKSVEGKLTCSRSCSSSLSNKARYKRNPELLRKVVEAGAAWSKGKTRDQLYSAERLKEVANAQSSGQSGDNNGRWGKNHRTQAEIDEYKRRVAELGKRCKGKTIEELYGKEKAAEIKKKISAKTSGSNNPMYGKPAPQKAGNGWKGWYKGRFFRSLLELSFLLECERNRVEIVSAEKAEFMVQYVDGTAERTYLPDYYLPLTGEVIELKPAVMVKFRLNALKFEAARKRFDKFKILTERDVPRIQLEDLLTLIDSGSVWLDLKTKEKLAKIP